VGYETKPVSLSRETGILQNLNNWVMRIQEVGIQLPHTGSRESILKSVSADSLCQKPVDRFTLPKYRYLL